jgi:hypothetical protein
MMSLPSLVDKYNIDLSTYTNRQKIEITEYCMIKAFNNIADELPVEHFVHAGMYYRKLTIPAGVCLTGKIHFDDHICTLEQGDLSVMTDDDIIRIQSPATFKGMEGSKKIGYAHTDVVFSTTHKAPYKTPEECEKKLFGDSDLTWVENLIDYKKFLIDCNLDEQNVSDISRNEEDMMFL